MRIKAALPLLIGLVLFASIILSAPARMRGGRGLGVGQTSTAGTRQYYALVIGNNAYTSLPKLKTAEADARAVATLLKDSYGFETKLLLNATRQQTMTALYSYRRELMPDTNLLIYYAGHGVNDKDADKAYWLPVDAGLDFDSNWIIADEITTGVRVIPAKHVLIVSDSCYSGTLARGLGVSLPRPSGREQFLRKMRAGKSRTLMASGGDEPVVDGGGGGHSVFANALLRGLRDMDKEQFTAAELFRYHIEEAVAGRAQQTPEYSPLINSGHEGGDFIFVRVKAGDKAVAATATPSGAPASDPAGEYGFWLAIEKSTDVEDFKDYLTRFPNGLYAGIAKRRVAALSSAAKPTPVTPPPAGNTPANTTGETRPVVHPQQMTNRAGVELVWIPAGSFLMGSEKGREDQRPVHRVTFNEGFYMGKYEVTQAQWRKVMGTSPSKFKGCDKCPVEQVLWIDAQSFIQKLNKQNDGYTYRLPTEAEWEYACRAGTTEDPEVLLESMGWFYPHAGGKTHPVGEKQPNAFGLFDMHGNVWEWVQDSYHESYAGAPTNGSAWLSRDRHGSRGVRGVSWIDDAGGCAVRSTMIQGIPSLIVGFRIAASARAS